MNNFICNSYIYDTNITDAKLKKIDFNKIDIMNTAFAEVEKNEIGAYVPVLNDDLREKIYILKKHIALQNARTKIVISIGGYRADNFCPASSSGKSRKAFADECKKILDTYDVDGIDIDWEFPGEKTSGISACKNCKKDFIKLCAEIRASIRDKLLTCAVGAGKHHGIDGKKLNSLVDYINVMTYDINKSHHSHLMMSKIFIWCWKHSGIEKHKLLLGIPFYSRCKNTKYEWTAYNTLMELVQSGKAEIIYTKTRIMF